MILFNKCYINLLFGLMVTFDVWKGLLFTSFLMINSSLKFEIMAKQLYVASQRVL